MALATASTIRDRISALITALTPTSLASDKFREFRNEGGAAFIEAMETKPAAALRRFQVREQGEDNPPDVSNTDLEALETEFVITIAYPQTHRFGAQNALDRDDVMNQDWKSIKHNVCGTGGLSRSNFSTGTTGSYDCTPLPCSRSTERGQSVDFLVIRARFRYQRSTT